MEQRFWSRVEKDGPIPLCDPSLGPCWEWIGYRRKDGYGRVTLVGVTIMAHRYAYEASVGKIPDGLELDHLCRNRCCVNPKHLEPVTMLENVRRGLAYRMRPDRCKRGHDLSGKNLYIGTAGRRVCIICNRMKTRESEARMRQRNYARGLTWNGRKRKQIGLAGAREIRRRAKAGTALRTLSSMYDLEAKQIRNILSGRCWAEPVA